jgi:hypothetical protein
MKKFLKIFYYVSLAIFVSLLLYTFVDITLYFYKKVGYLKVNLVLLNMFLIVFLVNYFDFEN